MEYTRHRVGLKFRGSVDNKLPYARVSYLNCPGLLIDLDKVFAPDSKTLNPRDCSSGLGVLLAYPDWQSIL